MKVAITLIAVMMISLGQYTDIDEIRYDYYEGIELAKEKKKPMFLLFTSRNCENPVQLNKLLENDKEISSIMKESFVPVILFVDDRTKLPKEKLVIQNGEDVIIKTKGNEWEHIEISKYKNNVQPLMVIVDSNENMLKPQLYGKLDRDVILDYLKQ